MLRGSTGVPNSEANTSPWSCHWSPQQIAQWLRQEFREDVAMRISHESIYRDLYMPSRIVFDASMFHRLRTDRPIHGRSVSGPPTARPDPQHSLHPRASRRGDARSRTEWLTSLRSLNAMRPVLRLTE